MRVSNDTPQNIISFVAHGAKVDVHRHHRFQIVISLNSAFTCTIGGEVFTNKIGFIVNQNIPHSCIAQV